MKQHENSPTNDDLKKLSHIYQVKFAIFCARQVIHLVDEKYLSTCEKTIEVVEKWLIGEASDEECSATANAAYATANAAAYAAAYAAYAAAHAAYAAAYAAITANAAAYAANAAAHANDKQKLINEQWEVYNDLLNINVCLENAIGLSS